MRLKNFYIIIIALFISACAFKKPLFFDAKVPEGPPAFKAGWYDGCHSAFAAKGSMGNVGQTHTDRISGIRITDPKYQAGWSYAYFTCATATGVTRHLHPLAKHPLQ